MAVGRAMGGSEARIVNCTVPQSVPRASEEAEVVLQHGSLVVLEIHCET